MLIRAPRHTGMWRPPGPVMLDRDAALAQNLIGWWPAGPTSREIAFDTNAASSTAIRELVNQHHATNAGNLLPRATPNGLACESITASATGYATCSTSRFTFPTSEGTQSYWTRMDLATPSDPTDTGWGYALGVAAASHYVYIDGLVYLSELSSARDINGVSPLAGVDRTQWHLVTLVSRAGTNGYRFFQNGRLAAQATRSGFTTLSSTGYLAGQVSGLYIVRGWCCDFRLYNRALSDDEVWALYDPQTRWSIYGQASRRLFIDVGAPPPPPESQPFFRRQYAGWTPRAA